MTLTGQWISRYAGNNSGTLVVDIDDCADHYRGVVCAWDDDPKLPNSLVRFTTSSKANAHRLERLNVWPMDDFGNLILPDEMAKAQTTGLLFPEFVDVGFDLKGSALSVKWTTSIQSYGGSVATLAKTRGGQRSELKPLPIKSWAAFKRYVGKLAQKHFIFRGQEDSTWRLRASFYRSVRANLERYLVDDVKDLQKAFSVMTPYPLNLADALHYGAFLNLAQHHGYPTPMLDWTWSPYVAAFFAFRNIRPHEKPDKNHNIRIYKFNALGWNTEILRFDKLFPLRPHVSLLDPLAIGNVRAIPQQAISLITNVDDIEHHVQQVEVNRKKVYLEVIELPASERNHVMKDLALMGITAGSLFPGLDGACESLRERNF